MTRVLIEPGVGGVLPLRRLAPAERVALAGEILRCYLAARLALREGPIETTVARLRRPPAGVNAPRRVPAVAEAQRLARAVARTLAPLPGDTRCLVRSLVLIRVLARRGIPSTLVIGARSAPGFLAHAWVEHAGQPVLDPGDGQFARLVEL
jgi:Transglutaminase-like superfamily